MRIKCIHWMHIILIGIMMVTLVDPVRAVDTYVVSTDASVIRKVDDLHYVIPVCITENHGIMGFRIILQNETDLGRITAISKGNVTQNGNFNTDLNVLSEQSVVNILWSGTEQCQEDGSLFYVTYELHDKNIKKIELQISYSQQDTFNEKYEDVTLQCQNAALELEEKKDSNNSSDLAELLNRDVEQKYYEEASKTASNTSTGITEEMIKYAVVHALNDREYTSLNSVSDQEADAFWSDVREYLEQDCGISRSELRKTDVQKAAEQVVIADDDFEKYSMDAAAPKKQKNSKQEGHSRLYPVIAGGVLLLMVVAGICIVRRFGHGAKN